MGSTRQWVEQREKILRLRRKGVTDSLKIAAATGIGVWPIRGVLSWYTRDHYRKQRMSRLRAQHSKRPSATVNLFPDEVKGKLREGATKRVIVNAYERDRRARQQCINEYGRKCCVCHMLFGKKYGKQFDNLIHVHHLRPIHQIGKEYHVDPIKDLRPVCPNCHAVIHHHLKQPYSIKKVQAFLRR